MNVEIRELSLEETVAVAGGYEPGDNICPPPRHWPFPNPWVIGGIGPVISPVVILGHG